MRKMGEWLAKEQWFVNIIGSGAGRCVRACKSGSRIQIMNKKQLKNLLVALGILVGIALVLSLVATLGS